MRAETLYSVGMTNEFSQKKLTALRERKGLSKYRLAKMAGMHYANYWRLESGEKIRPTVATVTKVARAMGVTMADLMG
jgi:transcriptional regulator with XRE-family HTH domain